MPYQQRNERSLTAEIGLWTIVDGRIFINTLIVVLE
jgi:hypothetical protein